MNCPEVQVVNHPSLQGPHLEAQGTCVVQYLVTDWLNDWVSLFQNDDQWEKSFPFPQHATFHLSFNPQGQLSTHETT